MRGQIMRSLTKRFAAITLAIGLTPALAFAQEPAPQPKAKGLKILEEDTYSALPERSPLMRGRLPEYVDLSSFFPVPRHQGDQGSCVGWAVGYALKTYQEAKELSITQPDEYYEFSPAFVFNTINQADNCLDGSYIVDALELIANVGAVRMQEFPYEPDQCVPPAEDIKRRAGSFSIKGYRRLQRDGMLFSIREALSNEKPVVIAMKTYESFDSWPGGTNYKPGEDEFQTGFHAVTVVGYSDERKGLKIINSWGTDWGDDGYFWMDYRAARNLIAEAYVTTDRTFADGPDDRLSIILADTNEGLETPPAGGETNAAASAPELAAEPVTEALLASAITGHVGRTSEGQTPLGYDYYPVSVWLDLEQTQLDQIEKVEYYFNHPTFFNPQRPAPDSNVFLASWKGYGCVREAEVRAFMTSGETLSAPFDLCVIWDKFHPGGFRKDGSRPGTEPLAEDANFNKSPFEKGSFQKKAVKRPPAPELEVSPNQKN